MQTNRKIQEISQSEPEHDKSFFGAPRITCGLLSKWANSGSLKNESRSPFVSLSVYFRTEWRPLVVVSGDVFVGGVAVAAAAAAVNWLLLMPPCGADKLTDAINSFSSNLRRSSGNNWWLLCDVLLILVLFELGSMCFGLLWPLLWTIGSASVLLVFSRSVWAFMGTFRVLRAWISISFSILFNRFISDICENQNNIYCSGRLNHSFVIIATFVQIEWSTRFYLPCNCNEVRSLAMYHRFESVPPEHFHGAVDALRASANFFDLCHRRHRYPTMAYIRWFGSYRKWK